MGVPGQSVELNWEVGHHADRSSGPERWVPATVPGAVQLDWAAAEGWEPYHIGENVRQYDWMEDRYWTYRTQLNVPALAEGQRLVFACGGVDYQFEVRLNGEVLHEQEGMFTPVELDLTGRAKRGDELQVRVYPAPKSVPTPQDRSQANRSCKPAVSYGWDFHPRLIPLGIWQETTLTVRPRGWMRRSELTYSLTDALDRADVTIAVSLDEAVEGRLSWVLKDPAGKVVAEEAAAIDGREATLRAAVERPVLWWPHDQGEPALYESVLQRLDASGEVVETRRRRVGFRRMRLVMNEGAWHLPKGFPKTRSTPPITVEINGRRIFAKGSNWVSPEIFPGLLSDERYREQLALVRDANMNILRMWGGAPIQKEGFYELCDELGIMVWQEFPLACNCYPDDPAYLRVLEQEARSIITRLREHPSVVLWCGGNELFNGWSWMTDQSHALRLLNTLCFELDRHTPFLPTSPVMGMGHGHYVFHDMETGEGAWGLFQKGGYTAYTEYGMAGPAPVEVLRKIIPEAELFPPKPGGAWETHHGFKAWKGGHLHRDMIEHLLGEATSLEDLIEKGTLIQAEGFKGLFEEARRQKPKASMALNWCLNEPWPTAANNSLISWPTVPRPAYHAVAQACRPVLASARIPRFIWREGEVLEAELWMLNDAPEAIPAGTVRVVLALGGRETPLLTWEHPELPPNTNVQGPVAQVRLPAADAERLELRLETATPDHASAYTLSYRPVQRKVSTGTRAMNL